MVITQLLVFMLSRQVSEWGETPRWISGKWCGCRWRIHDEETADYQRTAFTAHHHRRAADCSTTVRS